MNNLSAPACVHEFGENRIKIPWNLEMGIWNSHVSSTDTNVEMLLASLFFQFPQNPTRKLYIYKKPGNLNRRQLINCSICIGLRFCILDFYFLWNYGINGIINISTTDTNVSPTFSPNSHFIYSLQIAIR